jgi:hypothetical protein
MRILCIVFFALILFSAPYTVSAVDLKGESRTYLQARESADDHHLLPLFEYLDFSLDDFENEAVSIQFGGWARQDLTQPQSFDNRSYNGDVQYAYLNLRREEANAFLNLGRVLVNEGVSSELVDGLSLRTDLQGGFGIAAYGGIPVETDFDDRDGDEIYGGRVSHEIPDLYRMGASYLRSRNDSTDFRTEAGVDLWFSPFEILEITGLSTYNGETYGWMEHTYYVTLLSMEKLRLTSEISSINYEDYFQAVDSYTTSVFNLQPGIIDPREKMLLAGVGAQYALRDNLSFTADYKHYDYSVDDDADYYGGSVAYTPSDDMGGGLSLYRMDGQNDRREYFESRLYAYKKYSKADVTVDLFNITYDKQVNDVKNAYSASLAMGYNFTERARLGADLEYSHNPTFDDDLRAFLKFLYQFGELSDM